VDECMDEEQNGERNPHERPTRQTDIVAATLTPSDGGATIRDENLERVPDPNVRKLKSFNWRWQAARGRSQRVPFPVDSR
jgi:hypothetical protein